MKRPKFKKIDPDTLTLIKQVLVGFVSLAGVALLLWAVWHGTRMDVVTIDSVTVEGGETINLEHVRGIVERELEGEYLGFVPRRFSYFYPKSTIEESVSGIERVHSVEVDRDTRTNISVTFDEYVPYALWCENLDTNECLFLSQDGYAFGSAPVLQGGSFVRFVHLNEAPEVGRELTNDVDFGTVFRLIELFAENGWYVSQVELDQVGDAFLHIVGGGELKVALSTAPEQTVENLLVILTSEDFQHIVPGNFAYIDLRFGSKVFVNEELAGPEMGTASGTASSTISEESPVSHGAVDSDALTSTPD